MAKRYKHKRTIQLGSGRRLKLGQYAQAWRLVKRASVEGTALLTCDLEHPTDHRNRLPIETVLDQFRWAMHRRINERGGYVLEGRKVDPEWQFAAKYVASFVNGDPDQTYHPNQWLWIPRELRRAFSKRETPRD